MSRELQPGDPVEVHQIVAYAPLLPMRHWFGGYVFVRMRDACTAILQHTAGLYEGCEVNYALSDIRKVTVQP